MRDTTTNAKCEDTDGSFVVLYLLIQVVEYTLLIPGLTISEHNYLKRHILVSILNGRFER